MLLACSGTEYTSPLLIWWGGYSKEMLEERPKPSRENSVAPCLMSKDLDGSVRLCCLKIHLWVGSTPCVQLSLADVPELWHL